MAGNIPESPLLRELRLVTTGPELQKVYAKVKTLEEEHEVMKKKLEEKKPENMTTDDVPDSPLVKELRSAVTIPELMQALGKLGDIEEDHEATKKALESLTSEYEKMQHEKNMLITRHSNLMREYEHKVEEAKALEWIRNGPIQAAVSRALPGDQRIQVQYHDSFSNFYLRPGALIGELLEIAKHGFGKRGMDGYVITHVGRVLPEGEAIDHTNAYCLERKGVPDTEFCDLSCTYGQYNPYKARYA